MVMVPSRELILPTCKFLFLFCHLSFPFSLTHHFFFFFFFSCLRYKSKDSTYNNYKKPSVQLPMAPPTETSKILFLFYPNDPNFFIANIQFGSINQAYTPASTANGSNNKTGDIPVLKEVQFGSLPATDATLVSKLYFFILFLFILYQKESFAIQIPTATAAKNRDTQINSYYQ